MAAEHVNKPGGVQAFLVAERRFAKFVKSRTGLGRRGTLVVEAAVVAASAVTAVVLVSAINSGNNYPIPTQSPSGSSSSR
jgi:hypothetical protein